MLNKKSKVLKKFLGGSMALVFIVSQLTVCSAATSATAVYTSADESVKITLNTDRKEKTAVAYVENVLDDGVYHALAEFVRTDKNTFECIVALPDSCPSGRYTATVTIGGEKAESDAFRHINKAAAQKAMDLINGADALTLGGIIKNPQTDTVSGITINASADLAIDLSEFTANESKFTELYFKYKSAEYGASPLTIAQFSDYYNKCLFLSRLSNTSDEAAAIALLETAAADIGFDYDGDNGSFLYISKADNVLRPEEQKQEIIKRFTAGIYTEPALAQQYKLWFDLADINYKRDSSAEVYRGALEAFLGGIPGFDFTYYNEAANKNTVASIVMSSTYGSRQEIVDAFNAAVTTVGPEKKPTHNSGGSGGGSKGSGGSYGGGKDAPVDWSYTPQPDSGNSASQSAFVDVLQSHWAYESIAALAKMGILSGVGGGDFLPDRLVSRAEFSKMIMEALFPDKTGGKNGIFNDVNSWDWFSDYVSAAAEMGIVSGDGSGGFNPNGEITRQDMAVILYRAFIKAEVKMNTTKSFTDYDSIADYAKDAVSYVAGLGVLNGMGDGTFAPLAPLSRAQAAKAVYEAMKLVKTK